MYTNYENLHERILSTQKNKKQKQSSISVSGGKLMIFNAIIDVAKTFVKAM